MSILLIWFYDFVCDGNIINEKKNARQAQKSGVIFERRIATLSQIEIYSGKSIAGFRNGQSFHTVLNRCVYVYSTREFPIKNTL